MVILILMYKYIFVGAIKYEFNEEWFRAGFILFFFFKICYLWLMFVAGWVL